MSSHCNKPVFPPMIPIKMIILPDFVSFFAPTNPMPCGIYPGCQKPTMTGDDYWDYTPLYKPN